MAEAILQKELGNEFEVQSAGSNPSGDVHPLAIQVMGEKGLDLGDHRSKHLNEFLESSVETVITVCGNADQVCPVFPGQVNRHHFPFDDPADATGNEEAQLKVFRRLRDEIEAIFVAYAAGRKDENGRGSRR